MTWVYLSFAAATGLLLLCAIVSRRLAIVVALIALIALWPQVLALAGRPSPADARLAAEQWRVLAIAPVSANDFLVSALYANGDIVTYLLDLSDGEQRERMRQAQDSVRNGWVILGQAKRPPVGVSDGGMEFGFSEAPQTVEK